MTVPIESIYSSAMHPQTQLATGFDVDVSKYRHLGPEWIPGMPIQVYDAPEQYELMGATGVVEMDSHTVDRLNQYPVEFFGEAGEVIMTVPVTEKQKFSIWKRREQLREGYFEKYGGFSQVKSLVNSAVAVAAPNYMMIQRNWDRLNKVSPVGDYIRDAYKQLPD